MSGLRTVSGEDFVLIRACERLGFSMFVGLYKLRWLNQWEFWLGQHGLSLPIWRVSPCSWVV